MKQRLGYTDPFISPITGILSSGSQLPDLTRGNIWLGDKYSRPLESFKLIDLKIDVNSIFEQLDKIFSVSLLVSENSPLFKNSQDLSKLDTGLLKTTVSDNKAELSKAIPNVDYMDGAEVAVDNALVAFRDVSGKAIEMAGGLKPIFSTNQGGLLLDSITFRGASDVNYITLTTPALATAWILSFPVLPGGIPGLIPVVESYNPLTNKTQLTWALPGSIPSLKGPKGDKGDPGSSGKDADPLAAAAAGAVAGAISGAISGGVAGGVAGAEAGAAAGGAAALQRMGGNAANPANRPQNGRDGRQGERGERGDRGERGEQGARGDQGEPGRGIDDEGNLSARSIGLQDDADPDANITFNSRELNGSELALNVKEGNFSGNLTASTANFSGSLSADSIFSNNVSLNDLRFEDLSPVSNNYADWSAPEIFNNSYQMEIFDDLPQFEDDGIVYVRGGDLSSKNSLGDPLPKGKLAYLDISADYPLKRTITTDPVTLKKTVHFSFLGDPGGGEIDVPTAIAIVYGTLINVEDTLIGISSQRKTTDFEIKNLLPTLGGLSEISTSSMSLTNRQKLGFSLRSVTQNSDAPFLSLFAVQPSLETELFRVSSGYIDFFNNLLVSQAPPTLGGHLTNKTYVDSRVSGLGTVTQVTAGSGLETTPLGGITSSGSIALKNLTPNPAGTFKNANMTVNSQGLVTAISNGLSTPAVTSTRRIAIWGDALGSSLLNSSASIDTFGGGSFASVDILSSGYMTFNNGANSLTRVRGNPTLVGTAYVIMPTVDTTFPTLNATGFLANDGGNGVTAWRQISVSDISDIYSILGNIRFNGNTIQKNTVISPGSTISIDPRDTYGIVDVNSQLKCYDIFTIRRGGATSPSAAYLDIENFGGTGYTGPPLNFGRVFVQNGKLYFAYGSSSFYIAG